MSIPVQVLSAAAPVQAIYLVATHYEYGNWGGPGWSGGERLVEGQAVNRQADARDPLDALFKTHDIAYEEITTDFIAGIPFVPM